MKSFKKIALGLVAAMTVSTIVATPASAAVMTVAAYGASAHAGTAIAASGAGSGDSATNAIQIPVPSSNVVDDTKSVKFVATVDTGTVVSVTATNAFIVTALNTAAAPVTASAGSSTYSINVGTGVAATFYVFTKTTAIGSVSITNQGTTRTFYVQGTTTAVNSISVAGADIAAAGTQNVYTVTAVDVFGNKLPSVPLTATVANGTLAAATATTEASVLATYGTADFKVTLPASGSTTVIFGLGAAAVLQAEVAGFNTRTLTAAKVITVRDLAAELAIANAALAAEKAARAADKVAADKALADALAKAAADSATATAAAATAKAAADAAALTAAAEIAKLKADAVVAKVAADKALADAVAAAKVELDVLKAANAKALADLKTAFNALAKKWNAKNPKAKVATLK